MGKILSNGRIRSFIFEEAAQRPAPVRRQSAPVPVLREEILGVRFSEYVGCPRRFTIT